MDDCGVEMIKSCQDSERNDSRIIMCDYYKVLNSSPLSKLEYPWMPSK